MSGIRTKIVLKKQQMWVCTIAVLFVADFVFYGYLPSHRRLQTLRRSRTQKEHVIAMGVSQAEALPALEKRLENTRRMVKDYDDCVPTESALGVFLRQITDIMTEHELSDQGVTPGETLAANELNCIPVHMNCTGTLNGVFGFFRDLQGLERLIRIEKVTLKNNREFGGTVTMQTEAVIFHRPEKSQETNAVADDRPLTTANNDA